MNIDVFGVAFKKYGRKYYFSPGHLDIKCGMNVIVETERGFQYAEVVTDKTTVNKKTLLSPVKSIIRIATKEDDITSIVSQEVEKEDEAFCGEQFRRARDVRGGQQDARRVRRR